MHVARRYTQNPASFDYLILAGLNEGIDVGALHMCVRAASIRNDQHVYSRPRARFKRDDSATPKGLIVGMRRNDQCWASAELHRHARIVHHVSMQSRRLSIAQLVEQW